MKLFYLADEVRTIRRTRVCEDCRMRFPKGTRMRHTAVRDRDDGQGVTAHYWCLECTKGWDPPRRRPHWEDE